MSVKSSKNTIFIKDLEDQELGFDSLFESIIEEVWGGKLKDDPYEIEGEETSTSVSSKVTTYPLRPSFRGATETWETIYNYYGKILKITSRKVEVDCLIDKSNSEFQRRVFNRHLFENLNKVDVGVYVLIKIFVKGGKSMITISDAEKLVDKKIFEDYSEFSEIDDIETKESTITKL